MSESGKKFHTVKAANASVSKFQVGKQWVVRTWNASCGMWHESHPMDYWTAIAEVRTHKQVVRDGLLDGYLG